MDVYVGFYAILLVDFVQVLIFLTFQTFAELKEEESSLLKERTYLEKV